MYFFLDSAYKRYHIVWLTLLSMTISRSVHVSVQFTNFWQCTLCSYHHNPCNDHIHYPKVSNILYLFSLLLNIHELIFWMFRLFPKPWPQVSRTRVIYHTLQVYKVIFLIFLISTTLLGIHWRSWPCFILLHMSYQIQKNTFREVI